MHEIEPLEVSLAPGVVQYLGFRPDRMGMMASGSVILRKFDNTRLSLNFSDLGMHSIISSRLFLAMLSHLLPQTFWLYAVQNLAC